MAENSPRPTKRPRLHLTALLGSSVCIDSVNDISKDEEFWFDDGSIMLVAEKVGFKVYRGLMAAQSTIFADMLATGTPQPDQLYEGCPIVCLSDSVCDLRHLLRALISKSQILLYDPDRSDGYTFHQLSALIRLSHKYHIEDIQKQAVACLKTYYADTFNLWDEGTAFKSEPAFGEPIGVVHLAKLTDNPGMLPMAFYQCALLGGKVLQGWTREDGVVERLDEEDLARCIEGYGTLCRMIHPFLAGLFATAQPSPLCVSTGCCQRALREIYATDVQHWVRPSLLHAWRRIIRNGAERCGLCDDCEDLLLERETKGRRELWQKLPSIFNLTIEGWDEERAEGLPAS